jgi:hypothetical protein
MVGRSCPPGSANSPNKISGRSSTSYALNASTSRTPRRSSDAPTIGHQARKAPCEDTNLTRAPIDGSRVGAHQWVQPQRGRERPAEAGLYDDVDQARCLIVRRLAGSARPGRPPIPENRNRYCRDDRDNCKKHHVRHHRLPFPDDSWPISSLSRPLAATPRSRDSRGNIRQRLGSRWIATHRAGQ